MTRLTDEQVAKLWAETEAPHIRTFADRIAALAVQEVERERVGVNWEANFLSERHFRKEAEAKVATLTAQLAERDAEWEGKVKEARVDSVLFWDAVDAQRIRAERAEAQLAEVERARDDLLTQLAEVAKERDAHREQSRINDEVALCYRRDWQQAKAQLATAKREGWYEVAQYIQGQSHHPHPTDFGVATAIRAEADNRYPATPSGEGVPSCNGCGRKQGHGACECATPSPEAREVVIRCEASGNPHDPTLLVRITPADAKRIMDMAQRNI
jgi:hypothetical protein